MLKALAVEPQMNRRWEEQLARVMGFRELPRHQPWEVTSQAVQLADYLVTIAIGFSGELVIEGSLTVGELVKMAHAG